MLKFRIEAQEFSDFLSFVYLEGLVYDCIIDVQKKGLLIAEGLDISKAIFFRIVKEAKVVQGGELVIGNIAIFNKILSRFDGTVQIVADKKLIQIKRKNKVGKFEVADKKSIDSYVKTGTIKIGKDQIKTPSMKLKYKTSKFVLDSTDLSAIVADADTLDEHIYYIEVEKEGTVMFKVKKGRNVFKTKLEPEKIVVKKSIAAKFGHGIKEIFKTIDGEVKIYLEPKPPMLIRFGGTEFRSLYLIMTREEE